MIAASALLAAGLVGTVLSGLRLAKLRHRVRGRSESGTAALEFTLGFPFFLMSILVVMQTVLLLNGFVTVDYAAYAASRSASVWIGEGLPNESADRLGPRASSEKWQRITRAAVMACVPISPRMSQVDVGLGRIDIPRAFFDKLVQVSRTIGGAGAARAVATPMVLAERWAYSAANTDVTIGGTRRSGTGRFDDDGTVAVTVTHNYNMDVPFAGAALGRLLGNRHVPAIGGYHVPITATYTVWRWRGNEK